MKFHTIIAILTFIFINYSAISAADNKIIAIVNNQPITQQEYQNQKTLLLYLLNADKSDTNMVNSVEEFAIDNLIDHRLFLDQARKFKIEVTEKEIDEAISMLSEKNQLDLNEFIGKLRTNGVDSNFRNQVKSEIIKEKIFTKVLMGKISIPPKEIEEIINNSAKSDMKVSLKIFTSKSQDQKAYKNMLALRKRINNNSNILNKKECKSFATLENIDQNVSKLKPPKIQDIVKNLEEGQASSIINSGQNFKFIVAWQKKWINFSDEERENIVNTVGSYRLNLKAEEYYNTLRRQAFIKILSS